MDYIWYFSSNCNQDVNNAFRTIKIRMKNFIQALKELQEEKPGLWANIRAKKARGEKPAHKNSNAHKDAVKAGNKLKP
jgi:hypothetical protein